MNPPPPPPAPGDGEPQPAPREPLLDDPLFAEIVGPADADLPVAEPVRPAAAAVGVVDAEPVGDATSLPVAVPFSERPRPTMSTFPLPRPASKDPVEPPKPQWKTACCVMGCLGGAIVGAIAVLALIAMMLLGELGDQIAKKDKDPPNQPPAETAPGRRPGPVELTTLKENAKAISIKGKFDAVGRGAGGRYLFLHTPKPAQLLVFDPNVGDLVQTILLEEPDALFAAGASKLFVYLPQAERIDRYDLVSWQRDLKAAKPADVRRVHALAIGAAAEGPLYLIDATHNPGAMIRALETRGLTPETPAPFVIPSWNGRADGRVHARASDSGAVLGVASDAGALAIRFRARLTPPTATPLKKGNDPPLLATPSPDGQYLYTSRGVYDADGKHLFGTDRPNNFFTFPTAHGSGFYLNLNVRSSRVEGSPRFVAAGTRPQLAELESVTVPDGLDIDDETDVPADQRIHVWPRAGLVAVLPLERDRIEVRKENLQELLQQSRANFVAFASDPPAAFRKGLFWGYKPEVWSNNPKTVTLALVESPPGMQIQNGLVVWQPPADYQESPVVRIRATASGRTIDQAFRLYGE